MDGRSLAPACANHAGEHHGFHDLPAHGGPVHWGDHGELGIADLSAPDFGDAVTIKPGEVPVFWACGVTPQAALAEAALPLAVTHAPGHMLVTDVREAALEVPA